MKDLLETHGFAAISEQIISLSQPCIRMRFESKAEDDFAIGESRFGGRPDLLSDKNWPSAYGSPQAFMGQVRIADLLHLMPDITAASDGLLSFFLDLEEGEYGDFLFTPANQLSELKRIDCECDVDGLELEILRPIFEASLSLPPNSSSDSEKDGADLQGIQLTKAQNRAYTYRVLPQSFLPNHGCESYDTVLSKHQFFGWPLQIQDNISAKLDGNPEDWTLLFQLDSCDQMGFQINDCGSAYFLIRKTDLAAGDFSRIETVVHFY